MQDMNSRGEEAVGQKVQIAATRVDTRADRVSHQQRDAASPARGRYVYCVIEADEQRTFGTSGIGGAGAEVHTIHHDGLAAVVSATPIVIYDPTRENLLAHETVNQAVMGEFTVLPMSFGTVFRTPVDVVEFLKDTCEALRPVLARMRGKIEFGLRVNWDPEAALAETEREHEEIARLKEELASNGSTASYFARLQLGRLVERAMTERREHCVRAIYEGLRDYAIASRENKPIGDRMILNAAFLVERDRASQLRTRVEELERESRGKLRLQVTGPWPPYNFVSIRLRLESGRRGC